jgi:hypothetical protein
VKLFTPIYIPNTPFVNEKLKPKKAKKFNFELQESNCLRDGFYHFFYRKKEKTIHCFYIVEKRLLFIENNKLYDEFTSQFGREGKEEVGGMDTYIDMDSLENVPEKLTKAMNAGTYEEDTPPPICYIYGKSMWDDNAYIVANRTALEELREAIDIALQHGEFRLTLFPSDKEGYDLFISCVQDDFNWALLRLALSRPNGF